MGIYIKGLDWPELGMPIRITIFNDGAVNEEGIADYQAVEIKTPHGRLVDADAEYKALSEMKVEGEVFVTAVKFAKIQMEQVPTVIEAEPDEDCQTCKNYNTEKCNMCGVEADYYESAEKRGEWIQKKQSIDGEYEFIWIECSECHQRPYDDFESNFCPNCGVRMKGTDNETD